MSDPHKLSSPQAKEIEKALEDRKKDNLVVSEKGKKVKSNANKNNDKDAEKKTDTFATFYGLGQAIFAKSIFVLELAEGGSHCNHRILKPSDPPETKGITYPKAFKPLQDIYDDSDLNAISELFKVGPGCSQELRTFWTPLFDPKSGESDLYLYTQRKLKMAKAAEFRTLMEPVKLGHSFDPAGRLGKGVAISPKVWVPEREWFAPSLRSVTMEDVFTIFPKAEIEMLTLILGRIGVGVSNHIPEGWGEAISHTARMAAVIVGKDPGLGKSTLFNGMTAAFSKCGFITQTFRSTDERFGMKATSLANIA